ncbi:MAG: hypothetical protein DRJ05_19130 [Bacteroidetes bacterium]|nr:MAG: hypothetical protein DRJ05_19130 [Bacteroidota bacterium]
MDSKHLVFFGAFMLFFLNNAYNQKIVKVSGSAEVRIEMNMTEEQTREKALKQAMINAIENEFGTYVEQSSDLVIQDGSHTFTIIGTTKVKGDWIETIGEPEFRESTKQVQGKHGNEIVNWIKCTVKGKARKAIPRTMLETFALKCPKIECRSEDFRSGNALYLYFKSPVNGYVSVFLDDGNTVVRLLPYNNMNGNDLNAVAVEADKAYFFFDKDIQYFGNETVDELELHTKKHKELNTLHIIFATEKFVKPILDPSHENSNYKEGYTTPKTLGISGFNKWMAGNKTALTSFQDKKVVISIRSNR